MSEATLSGAFAPLAIARYRFTACFDQDLRLPEYAGSVLRGAFGAALRRTACMTGQPHCPDCPLWRSCPYPALFETPPRQTLLRQQFSQVPNPYVIEPPSWGTRSIAAGEPLVFHMVLIGRDSLRQLALVVHAWQRALRHGLGPQRIPGWLESVDWLPDEVGGRSLPVLDPQSGRVVAHDPLLVIEPLLTGTHDTALTVHLDIDTPMRLQREGHALGRDELSARVLVTQLLRRTSLMLDLHLGMPLPYDGPALIGLTANLEDDRSGLRWRDWIRHSSRQQQDMTLGGVTGRWTLNGPLASLLPWLKLGQWLHIGKNATMGMGAYRLTNSTLNRFGL